MNRSWRGLPLPVRVTCCLRYSYLTVLPSSHRVTSGRGLPRQALLQAPGKNLLGQLTSDEYHLGGRFVGRGPRLAGFGAHHHVHTLEQHAAVDALHVQDALVAQQVGTIDLHHAAQEFLKTRGIERLVGTEHERADFVVVLVVVVMMRMIAMRPAIAVVIVVVIMSMVVAVVVTMRMGGVGVLIGQEFRVDVQNGIQVEAADVDDGLEVGVAEVDGGDRRARFM